MTVIQKVIGNPTCRAPTHFPGKPRSLVGDSARLPLGEASERAWFPGKTDQTSGPHRLDISTIQLSYKLEEILRQEKRNIFKETKSVFKKKNWNS